MSTENSARHIAHLDERLRKLEDVIRVKPNGNVEIKTTGSLRIEANVGVEITSNNTVKIFDFYGNSISMGASGTTIEAAARLSMTCSVFNLSSGTAEHSTGMARFSGVVQCDTIIANSVVGASYTPGAGNIY